MNYTVYITATGEIIGNGFADGATNLNQISHNTGESLIEGVYDGSLYNITDGSAVSKDGPSVIDYIRSQRTFLLAESDWTQVVDSPFSDSKKAEWATYRQALRDLPTTQASASTENDIVFPTVPS